jgi:ubiquinone/menaquinone biosynthesis C-methylase UbiE
VLLHCILSENWSEIDAGCKIITTKDKMPSSSGKDSGLPRAQTRANYDRLSPFYDLLAGSSERACRTAGLNLLAASPGERILEIGSGTGQALPALAGKLAPNGVVFGLDLSSGMLMIARERVRKAGKQSNTGLALGDAVTAPFAAGAFDGVFTTFTLELFTQAEFPIVLAECRRLLRPGGRIAVVSLCLKTRGALSRGMLATYQWAHRAFPAVVDCRPIEIDVVLQRAGFTIQAEKVLSMWGLPVGIVLGLKNQT